MTIEFWKRQQKKNLRRRNRIAAYNRHQIRSQKITRHKTLPCDYRPIEMDKNMFSALMAFMVHKRQITTVQKSQRGA